MIRWTPAAADTRVRLTRNSNNSYHGQPYHTIIECDAPDSAGEIAVPAAILDAFPDSEAWAICAGTDCPRSKIERYRRATHPVDAEHDLELLVTSRVWFGLDHERP